MPTTAVIIVTALVTAVGGYLMNQLPEVRQFKGRNWLIIRLFVWITLVPVAYELLTNEQVLEYVKTVTKFSVAPLVLLLILDLWKLVAVALGQADSKYEVAPQDLRTRLLKAVQTEVAERLEDSLNQQVVINLLMQQQLSQVNRPDKQKQISLEEIEEKRAESNLILLPGRSLKRDHTSTRLDPQESILDTFNRRDVGRKLLILGAPGSGKTTTLLRLAEVLVEGALQDGQTLIPIIFELSTWKDDNQSIHDWLIGQLKLSYNIDPKTGTKWLKDTHLLPLLDGLDELGLKRQITCVEKINEFVRGLTYPHVVVCCRNEEYAEGQVRLSALKGAVCLEPLSNIQIQQYLCEQLKQPEIWQAIQRQSKLRTLLESSAEREVGILRIPLFLTMLSVTYGAETLIESDKDLFNAYIHKRLVLNTRQTEREQLKRAWAYKTIDKEPDEEKSRQYLSWLARMLNSQNLVEFLIERMQPTWLSSTTQIGFYRLIVGLIIGLSVGLYVGLSSWLSIWLIDTRVNGLLGGLIFGSVFGVVFGVIVGMTAIDIELKEKFQWSVRRSLLGGVSLGLLFGLRDSLSKGLLTGLISGLISGLFCGLFFGLISVSITKKEIPNQGIRKSIRNALYIWLFCGLMFGLIFGLLGRLSVWPASDLGGGLMGGLSAGLLGGLIFGLLGGLLGGADTAIKHSMLRIFLAKNGSTPWNYARFLNYCAERHLLQRIGGRYRFIHRELLDRFAEM